MHTVLTPAMEDGEKGRGEGGRNPCKHTHVRTQSQPHERRGNTTRDRDRGFNDHAACQQCLPIRLGLLLSLLLLVAAEWNSFPQQTPVPGSSRQAVLVPSLLRLYRIIIAVYVIYQRHCANCSAKRQHHNTTQHNRHVMLHGGQEGPAAV